uniref:Uncharacterized protein n=1 Tax=Romanomermis culicivorax TaxID=13658 RepID=A0A915HEN7_ROMCU
MGLGSARATDTFGEARFRLYVVSMNDDDCTVGVLLVTSFRQLGAWEKCSHNLGSTENVKFYTSLSSLKVLFLQSNEQNFRLRDNARKKY